jgi:hypothetical protein
MRAAAALLVALAGCSAVYNAQYDDRKAELEQSRQLFLPGSDTVSAFAGGEDRIYWLDTEQAAEAVVLRSIDMRSGLQTNYLADVSFDAFHTESYGDDLFALCGGVSAFHADASEASPFATLDNNGEWPCAVVGDDIYVIAVPGSDFELAKWTPPAGSAAPVFDLTAAGIHADSVGGFGPIDGQRYFYQEGGNGWLLDTASGSGKLLNASTDTVAGGSVVYDGSGVVFMDASGAARYTPYEHPMQDTLVSDMIANGGYDLNFEHGDIQDIVTGDGANYTLYQRHLIYKAQGGIFALGLDSGIVVDLLLDGRPDDYDDMTPLYDAPTVTEDGWLFVQEVADDAPDYQAIYRVNLDGRLP